MKRLDAPLLPTDEDRRMDSRRTPLIAFALAALTPLAACGHNEPSGAPKGNPIKAVKEFLIDGSVDQNGYAACVYLTTRAQRAAAKRAGGPECRQAFDLATFRLGGEKIDTVQEVRHLTATSSIHGNRASVRVVKNGGRVRFELVKATRSEQKQFLAPDTEWRISRGGLSVVQPERL
jgi:hypothetical protein